MNTLLLLLTLVGVAPAGDPAPTTEEAADVGLGEPPLGDVPGHCQAGGAAAHHENIDESHDRFRPARGEEDRMSSGARG